MGAGKLSVSLLALAGGAVGADLPSITMKVRAEIAQCSAAALVLLTSILA
jgi:hypothetical protein